MRKDFGHWLAGFIDGEGCFFIHKRNKQMYVPQFSLKLRDDDIKILEECIKNTGIGKLVFVSRDRSKPQVKWNVIKKVECLILAEILTKYPLRAKKKRDFEIWKDSVVLWNEQKREPIPGGGIKKFSCGEQMKLNYEKLKRIRKYEGVVC